MPAVHHYTSIKAAMNILDSGKLWFTERAHLNDPSEFQRGINICENELRKQEKMNEVNQFVQNVQSIFERFRFFSASFTITGESTDHPRDDDINQWLRYADNGRGVVLSFKDNAFDKPQNHINRLILGDPPPTVFVTPMSYGEAELKHVIQEIIKVWNGQNITELCDHVFFISSLFKDKAWESEHEYRFFIHHDRARILQNPLYKTRERNGEVISYLDVPIQNWCSKDNFPIYRIRLGPAAPTNLSVQLGDFLFAKGIPNGACRIEKSSIPYR